MRECIQEAQSWIYGDTYLILDRPLSSVVDYMAKDLKVILGIVLFLLGAVRTLLPESAVHFDDHEL